MTIAKILLIIHTLVSGEHDWQKFVKEMDVQYEQAEKDGIDSSMNSFLNRKLIEHCSNCKNSEEDVKKTLYLVAMYKEKDCQLPEKGETFVCKYKDKLFSIVTRAIKDHLDKDTEVQVTKVEAKNKEK